MDDAIERLRAEIERLKEALMLARSTCGRGNCNCVGSSKVKAVVELALAQIDATHASEDGVSR